MTRKQLEEKRDGLEAQMHWAALHRGDQELMDVLRDESGRLSMMMRSDGRHRSGRHPMPSREGTAERVDGQHARAR
jgi:hypothetical protein